MRTDDLVRRAFALVFQAMIIVLVAGLFVFGGIPMMAFRWEMEDALTSSEKTSIDTPECPRHVPPTEPGGGQACPEMNFKRRAEHELRQ